MDIWILCVHAQTSTYGHVSVCAQTQDEWNRLIHSTVRKLSGQAAVYKPLTNPWNEDGLHNSSHEDIMGWTYPMNLGKTVLECVYLVLGMCVVCGCWAHVLVCGGWRLMSSLSSVSCHLYFCIFVQIFMFKNANGCEHPGMYVELRGQLVWVYSLLLPYGFQDQTPGCQAWQ